MRMRSVGGVLVRLICSLALVLAALPIRATGMDACALAATTQKAACGMTCCSPSKPAPVESCCKTKHLAVRAFAVVIEDCKCIASSDSDAPASAGKTFAGFQDHETALASVPAFTLAPATPDIQPGIFGVDSGPPIASEHSPDLGRAPPVARA